MVQQDTNKIVAIHQPNFFPWLGYFNKIKRADVFILLDNVQFSKTGGTWTNRVKIIVDNKADWITVPIVRSYHGYKQVNEIEINDLISWRKKTIATIESNYHKTKYFIEIFPLLVSLFNNNIGKLCDFNINILQTLMDMLDLPWTKCILASTLGVRTKATDMLIDLTHNVGGTAYLCGGGATGYQEDEKFTKANLKLIYQNYKDPLYPQHNMEDHIYGLSIIDVLMNCGIKGTKKLISHQYGE